MSAQNHSDFIPLSIPDIDGDDEASVLACLRSGEVSTASPWVSRLEAAFTDHLGGGHAVAYCSGTAALKAALEESGACPGRAVLLPTLTYMATVHTVLHTGAQPVFVDTEAPDQLGMAPAAVAERLDALEAAGTSVAAVMIAHLYGLAADAEALAALCTAREIPLIEDAAEALGVRCRGGRPAGSLGQLGVFSLNGNKIITAGGGGVLMTNDEAVAERRRHLQRQARVPGLDQLHDAVGDNTRMTGLAAALGMSQLRRLKSLVERRRAVMKRYRQELDGLAGTRLLDAPAGTEASFWLPVLIVSRDAGANVSARDLAQALEQRGIGARLVFRPAHEQAYLSSHHDGRPLPNAELLHRTGVCLPASASLSESQQQRIVKEIRDLLG